jgi:hypothetical protein
MVSHAAVSARAGSHDRRSLRREQPTFAATATCGRIDGSKGNTGGNLHLDGSPHVIRTTITLWHFDAGSGRRPSHHNRTPERCGHSSTHFRCRGGGQGRLGRALRAPSRRKLLFGYSGDAQCCRHFVPEFAIHQIHGSGAQRGQRQLRLSFEDFPRDLRGFALSSLFDQTYS